MERIPLIAANWKMYKTSQEARLFIDILSSSPSLDKRRICLFVPFTSIEQAVHASQGKRIAIGAQNMHDRIEGAFTGEISARMLRAAGAHAVLLGHSERRQLFGETNVFINRKVKCACQERLTPFLCIGESGAERDSGGTQDLLHSQLEECLEGIRADQIRELVIAYEPIWAIGTGKTADPQTAQETHRWIREIIDKHWGETASREVCLLYGGSVKPDNIAHLMQEPDIDGVLVGGASLDPASFTQLINY